MTDSPITETAMPDVLYTKRPRGRPSLYTDELVGQICDAIAAGKSLRAICAEPGMPDKSTVMRWLTTHEDFRDRYRRAREMQIDILADEIVEIADAAMAATDRLELAKAKLRIDARKWLITHLVPKKYGAGWEARADREQPIQMVISEKDARVF